MGGQTSKNSFETLRAQLSISVRRVFETKWEEINQKGGDKGEATLEHFLADYPPALKIPLIKIISHELDEINSDNLKAQLLKFTVELKSKPIDIFLELYEVSELSLISMAKTFSELYLKTWGNKLHTSEHCIETLCEHLILAHWSKKEYNGELDEVEKDEWLSKTSKSGQLSKNELEDWFFNNIAFQSIFIYCLERCLLGCEGLSHPDNIAPQITGGEFKASTCWLLYQNIPNDCRKEWKLLYSSKLHGASWNGFQKSISKAGSTIFLVKEKTSSVKPHIFGAFSYIDWNVNPRFYGDGQSFLFTSSPKLRAYRPTMYNQNFQYFNQGAQTLPNGIGLGGQLEYFGLWIDRSFERGTSKAEPRCSTYNSPQLSSRQEFLIEDAEVWCLRSNEDQEDSVQKKSILDSDPEAAALLEMASRPMYSQGLRDPALNSD